MQAHTIQTWTQPRGQITVHAPSRQPSRQEPSAAARTCVDACVTQVTDQLAREDGTAKIPLWGRSGYPTPSSQVYVGGKSGHGHRPPDDTPRAVTAPPWPRSAATSSVVAPLTLTTRTACQGIPRTRHPDPWPSHPYRRPASPALPPSTTSATPHCRCRSPLPVAGTYSSTTPARTPPVRRGVRKECARRQ